MNEHKSESESEHKSKRTLKSRIESFLFLLFGILLIVGAVVALERMERGRAESLKTETQTRESRLRAGARVEIGAAVRGPTTRTVELTGEGRPYQQATLYAKVSGYLRDIKVDVGDKVKEGQVLAVIESPELDRQYDSALADQKNKEAEAKRGLEVMGREAFPGRMRRPGLRRPAWPKPPLNRWPFKSSMKLSRRLSRERSRRASPTRAHSSRTPRIRRALLCPSLRFPR